MTQKRLHDYRSFESTADLNHKYVDIIPPGVYKGFNVLANGNIMPGTLLTPDGVRVEENGIVQPNWGDTWSNLGLPPGDSLHPRRDLIVCQYEYEQSIPAPAARYKVIQGTPAASPQYPVIPDDHCLVLAWCLMPQAGTTYSDVLLPGPPERLVNCARELDGVIRVIDGTQACLRTAFNVNTGTFDMWIQAAGAQDDGESIGWGDPVLSVGENGISALNAFVNALAHAGANPGASKIGVRSKAGANNLLSIEDSTLQDALDRMVTAIDAKFKSTDTTVTENASAASTALSNHQNSTTAHAADHLTAAAATATHGAQFAQGTLQAALSALLGLIDTEIYGRTQKTDDLETRTTANTNATTPEHGTTGYHKAISQKYEAGENGFKLLWSAGYGNQKARLYAFNQDDYSVTPPAIQNSHGVRHLLLTVNAYFDSGSSTWFRDDSTNISYCFTFGSNNGFEVLYQDTVTWALNAWKRSAMLDANGATVGKIFGTKIFIDPATGFLLFGDLVDEMEGTGLKLAKETDGTHPALVVNGVLRALNGIRIGAANGVTHTSGSGAKSGTDSTVTPGSTWYRTDAPTGHSGVYVYNYYSGWGELALVV